MIKCLTSLVLAIILTLIVGIPITASTATLAVFVICGFLIDEAVKKVKEKKLPTVLEWVLYGAVFVALILAEIGIFYTNIYVLIVAVIVLIIGLICALIRRKKEKTDENA